MATAALAGRVLRRCARPSTRRSGPTQLIFAFEAVVIGGLGSLWGTLVGGIVLGVAQTVGAQIDPQYSILAGHLVFLAVLAFRRGARRGAAGAARERRGAPAMTHLAGRGAAEPRGPRRPSTAWTRRRASFVSGAVACSLVLLAFVPFAFSAERDRRS